MKFSRLNCNYCIISIIIVLISSCDKLDNIKDPGVIQYYSRSKLEKTIDSYIESLTSRKLAGRKAGTTGGLLARDYLVNELFKMGHEVSIESFTIKSEREYYNVIVPIKGNSEKTIIIGAHYDGPLESYGDVHYQNANDNASGTVTLLALANILSYNIDLLDYSIMLCFWDAEETTEGEILNGSLAFTKSHDLDSAYYYINIDGVGVADNENRIDLYANNQLVLDDFCTYTNQISSSELNIKFIVDDRILKNLDTYSFYKIGVPYAFWTCPSELHNNNHSLQDQANLLSQSKIRLIAEYTYLIISHFEHE